MPRQRLKKNIGNFTRGFVAKHLSFAKSPQKLSCKVTTTVDERK